jgi:hypothetical protein
MKVSKIIVLLALLLAFVLSVSAQTKSPKTVREFFMLLPQKYFEIEDITHDKKLFLERFLRVEDNKNSYMEADGDGSQEHFKMALFKRSNGTYIVGLYVFGEWGDKSYFLEYKNRKWTDVSKNLVPQYKKSNIYDFPHF